MSSRTLVPFIALLTVLAVALMGAFALRSFFNVPVAQTALQRGAAPHNAQSPVQIITNQQVPLIISVGALGMTETQPITIVVDALTTLTVSGDRVIARDLAINAAPAPDNVLDVTVETARSVESNVMVATLTPTPEPTATSTPTPSDTPEAAAIIAPGQQYLIDQRVYSSQLEEIQFTVRGAEVTSDEVRLHVAFENPANEPLRYSFISQLNKRTVRLIDAQGNGYDAIELDDTLAKVQPENGFAPGGANVGTIAFPRPDGPAPYRLRGVFDFADVEFSLNAPVRNTTLLAVPLGTYPVNQSLFSDNEVLSPLQLRIDHVEVTADNLILHVAFVNTGFQQYGLRIGPKGSDAWLLDRAGRQSVPLAVSDSIEDSITPDDGIAPNAAHTGTITFNRPAQLDEVRFIFNQYSPLHLRFDVNGLATGELASASGGAVATPTPQPAMVAYRALKELLDAQAQAISSGEVGAYLATLDPTIWGDQTAIFQRVERLPFDTFQWTLEANQDFDDAVTGTLSQISTQMRFTLEGIPEDNVFVHDFVLDFARSNGAWQITNMSPGQNPPFWWNGDIVLTTTPHFLVFTRPTSLNEAAIIETEVETAYAALQAIGLPLESRYVAYFTAPEDDFVQLTGESNPNALGIALTRYQLEEERIDVIGRAFFINGSKFADERFAGERQSTITHELVHLALSHDARPFTPPWLSEGLAVYYSGQDTADERLRLYEEGQMNSVNLSQLTGLDSLGEHDFIGKTTGYRYIYSGATIRYLIETYGEEQLFAFYRTYANVPAADVKDRMPTFATSLTRKAIFKNLGQELTVTNVQAILGITLEELDARVKAWLIPK